MTVLVPVAGTAGQVPARSLHRHGSDRLPGVRPPAGPRPVLRPPRAGAHGSPPLPTLMPTGRS
jgi:hypothetical protein